MKTAMVRFENVSKVYRLGESRRSLRETIARVGQALLQKGSRQDQGFRALRDVSFEVQQGEALGIIGPNGAGKTTTLKLLSKITQPTSGIVTVKGRLSALIELGAGFHPDLTGRENIYLNGAILGLTRNEIDHRFDSIVAFSGLESFIDTPVKRYSSGMYVRLGFSVAAHVEPEVLLVDEVLSVGDAEFRERCAERIKRLRLSGTTIVFISHNLPLVQSVCDRAIYLEAGRIRAAGDVIEAIRAYEQGFHRSQMRKAPRLSTSPGIDNHSPVLITKVEIHSIGDKQPGGLTPSDPAEIRVQWRTQQPLARPNLVLRIIRADGVVCGMIRTRDQGYDLQDLARQGSILLTVNPLQLMGGIYALDARLLGSLDGVPLARAHSGWFQVGNESLGHGESGGIYTPLVASARVELDPTPETS